MNLSARSKLALKQQQVLPVPTTWYVHLLLHLLHRVVTDPKILMAIPALLRLLLLSGRTVDRDSGTFGVEVYDYGDVEIASEVGWDNYKRVADGIMRLYQSTGLLHGYSYNWWSDLAIMDDSFIEEWLDSPQTSLYYSLQVMGDVQDKSDAYASSEGCGC